MQTWTWNEHDKVMVQDYFRDFSFGLATNARAYKGVGVEREAQ
jgi:hypothetical protein